MTRSDVSALDALQCAGSARCILRRSQPSGCFRKETFMHVIDVQASVGALVREIPARARVFESFQIDYCCGGKITLAEACGQASVDLGEVVSRLHACEAASQTADVVDADGMTLSALADHIEQTHHAYLREELPRLDQLTEKVSRVHGEKEPRLLQVREAFLALRGELEPHMLKEERVLFPMVRQLEASADCSDFPCGGIANPIRQMEHEHDNAGQALAILHEATDGYAPPEWACNTYRAMLDSLQQLEADMHQHIHKENNVLFPKALQMQPALSEPQ